MGGRYSLLLTVWCQVNTPKRFVPSTSQSINAAKTLDLLRLNRLDLRETRGSALKTDPLLSNGRLVTRTCFSYYQSVSGKKNALVIREYPVSDSDVSISSPEKYQV